MINMIINNESNNDNEIVNNEIIMKWCNIIM